MELEAVQSGLAGLWDDLRRFLAGVRLSRPGWLLLSLAPLIIALLTRWQARRQQRALDRLGHPASVHRLLEGAPRRPRQARLLVTLAWTSLVLGLAGPHWGRAPADSVAIGRDVVVVLDLSRSMLAEDLSEGAWPRWQAAVAATRDLIDAAEIRGGHRLAIVIFAARAKLLVPLTTDYAHLRAMLDTLDATRPMEAIRPGEGPVVSGTRIGAGLTLGVESHDQRFPGRQDVILITDADDPAGDLEWKHGVRAARAAGIPVHVLAIGDPDADSPLFLDGRAIEGPDENGIQTQALTRLREAVAEEIARDTGGQYLPARRDRPELGRFFRERIQDLPSRDLTDDATSLLVDRSGWCFGLSLGLLILSLMVGRSRSH